MKKNILSSSVIAASLIVAATAQAADLNRKIGDQELKVKLFGFTQITAESGDGLRKKYDNKKDGLVFGADRVRIGYKLSMGKVFSKLQIDFNKNGKGAKDGQLDEIIKDALVGYKFSNAASVKFGEFKTPIGMDFNTSGKKLDITKRGMEKKLVLERSAGAMLSGRKIGNAMGGTFGYDAGVFNAATRSSKVVAEGAPDNEYAYTARGMFDTKALHLEASYGISQNAAGSNVNLVNEGQDYKVWDLAARYKINDLTLKAEYVDGSNIKGVNNQDENVWYLHAGYRFLPTVEGVLRHYEASYDADGQSSTDLGNTYIGLNYFINPASKHNARIQLNYVIASGDDGYTKPGSTKTYYGGVTGGYRDDVILAQFQVGF